jgi:hypothetical protein
VLITEEFIYNLRNLDKSECPIRRKLRKVKDEKVETKNCLKEENNEHIVKIAK